MKLVTFLIERVLTLGCWAAWFTVGLWAILPLLPFGGNPTLGLPAGVDLGFEESWDGPGGTWRVSALSVAVELRDDRPWGEYLAGWPLLLLFLVGVRSLRDLVRSLEAGSPFILANARRIRNVGVVILGYEVVRLAWTWFFVRQALEARPVHAGMLSLRVSVWPNLATVFMGLIVLLLAEVFRRGTEMQDEQQLTV